MMVRVSRSASACAYGKPLLNIPHVEMFLVKVLLFFVIMEFYHAVIRMSYDYSGHLWEFSGQTRRLSGRSSARNRLWFVSEVTTDVPRARVSIRAAPRHEVLMCFRSRCCQSGASSCRTS